VKCGVQIIPPVFSVFPVEEADRVFEQLSQCMINGRAVFRVSVSSNSDAEMMMSGDDTADSAVSTPTTPPDTTEPAFFLPQAST